jgi:hypothetical protein
VTKALPLAIIALGLFVSGARAVDWNVKSTMSQSLEANDNRAVSAVSKGDSYLSVSTLLFNANALTPTSSFNLNGNLAYRAFAGPGESGNEPTLDKGVRGRFEKFEKLTSYNASASYSETETAAIQLAETGTATLGGSTAITTVGGGLRHQLTPRDTVSLGVTRTTTESTASGNTSWSYTANLIHRVNPLTIFTPSLLFQLLDYDDAARTQVKFVTATMAGQTQLTKLVALTASAGVAWADVESRAAGGAGGAAANPANLRAGTSLDWLANVQLTYSLKSVVLALTAGRGVGPTTLGDFTTTESLSMSMVYKIDRDSNLSLLGSFSHQAPSTGSESDQYAAVIAYSRILAREWRSQLSYRFQTRNSDAGSATSNSVLLVVSRDVTILP